MSWNATGQPTAQTGARFREQAGAEPDSTSEVSGEDSTVLLILHALQFSWESLEGPDCLLHALGMSP